MAIPPLQRSLRLKDHLGNEMFHWPACRITQHPNIHRRFPHPKQVLVEDGMLSPDMAAFCAANTKRKQPSSSRYGNGSGRADENGKPQAQFVYPFGSTVLVQVSIIVPSNKHCLGSCITCSDPCVPVLSLSRLRCRVQHALFESYCLLLEPQP